MRYDTKACTQPDVESWYAESVVEDFATICDLLGFDIRQRRVTLMNGGYRYEPAVYWSGFWSQGDGACAEGRYSYRKGAAAAIRCHAPIDAELHRIADDLQTIQRRNFYALTASSNHRDRYHHENSVAIDVESSRDVSEDDQESVAELLRDLMRWVYRQLESEYEYQASFDAGAAFRRLASEVYEDGRKLIAERRTAGVEIDEWRDEWNEWRDDKAAFHRDLIDAAPSRRSVNHAAFWEGYRNGL